MRVVWVIWFSLCVCFGCVGGEEHILPDEIVGSFRIWLDDNVEDWVFDLAGVDQESLDQSLNEVQAEFKDALPSLIEPRRENAEQMLLALGKFSATRDYADQLQLLLDQVSNRGTPTNLVAPLLPPRPTPIEKRETWLTVMTKRPVPTQAHDYLERLKPIFQSEQIPPELVWVAEVESAFNPDARSPVGAVGLFQLMPETARSLGLSTWFPDDRRNVEKNARAAAEYFKYLHKRFGDWQLAVAAYNAGPTRVARLLRESDSFSYEAIAHRVPLETLGYVAKVEATLLVRAGVELSHLELPATLVSED